MGAPQRTRGAYANAVITAVLAETSGIEVEVGDTGLWLDYLAVDLAGAYGMTISDESLLDSAVSDVTLTGVFGVGAITTVVRKGRDSEGDTPGEGDFLFNATTSATIDAIGVPVLCEKSFYVAAGKFITIRRDGTNAAADVTIGFSEAIT